MGLSERERLAEEYFNSGYGTASPLRKKDFLAGYASRDAAFEELVEALKKYAEFDGEYRWISLTAREALAKYGKGGASG